MVMFSADLPDIEDVVKGPIIDPGTSVAQSIQQQQPQAIPEDIVDQVTGKKSAIPMWVWLLGGGAVVYFLFFRK
jgi:hypothetical protein